MRSNRSRRRAVAGLAVMACLGVGSAAPEAVAAAGAVTKTFSFIGSPGSKTSTLLNIDSLLLNARCNTAGSPVVFAFTSAPAADLFARVFDGLGRLHLIKNTAFTKTSKGVQLSPSSGDFDASGQAIFETSRGQVVSVNIAMDNSTTLNHQRLCTVFGTLTAS